MRQVTKVIYIPNPLAVVTALPATKPYNASSGSCFLEQDPTISALQCNPVSPVLPSAHVRTEEHGATSNLIGLAVKRCAALSASSLYHAVKHTLTSAPQQERQRMA